MLRERLEKESSLSHYDEMNVLSMHALTGAYTAEGRQWLCELREVIASNVDYVCDFFARELPGVTCAKPQGTYMLFVDCAGYAQAHGVSIADILKRGWDVGIGWQDGRPFFAPYGIRVNLAHPAEPRPAAHAGGGSLQAHEAVRFLRLTCSNFPLCA